MTSELPGQSFFTDEHVSLGPCASGTTRAPIRSSIITSPTISSSPGFFLDGRYPASVLDPSSTSFLDTVLRWARDTGTIDPSLHAVAIWLAFDRAPFQSAPRTPRRRLSLRAAMSWTDIVLRRMALDDPLLRHSLTEDVGESRREYGGVGVPGRARAAEREQRAHAAAAPTTVGILERLQADAGFLELRACARSAHGGDRRVVGRSPRRCRSSGTCSPASRRGSRALLGSISASAASSSQLGRRFVSLSLSGYWENPRF